MPSFDIESKVDIHELTNAVDQSNRVISNRFDFKNANSIYRGRIFPLFITFLSKNHFLHAFKYWQRLCLNKLMKGLENKAI